MFRLRWIYVNNAFKMAHFVLTKLNCSTFLTERRACRLAFLFTSRRRATGIPYFLCTRFVIHFTCHEITIQIEIERPSNSCWNIVVLQAHRGVYVVGQHGRGSQNLQGSSATRCTSQTSSASDKSPRQSRKYLMSQLVHRRFGTWMKYFICRLETWFSLCAAEWSVLKHWLVVFYNVCGRHSGNFRQFSSVNSIIFVHNWHFS